MALSANTVIEIRVGGSSTNGGGFVTGASGTDWSLQDAAQYSVTDGVTAGSTTITSATANFGTDVVGNLVYVAGGTGSVAANWYQITARNSATSITVDRSTGLTAGTGVTLKIGGALDSIGSLGALGVASGVTTVAFLKYSATAYTVSNGTVNTSGNANSAGGFGSLYGYDTNRTFYNTDANRPTIKLIAGSVTAITQSGGSPHAISNVIFDGNGQTASRATVAATSFTITNCKYIGFATSVSTSSTTIYSRCEFTANTATPVVAGAYIYCSIHDNTGATTDGANPANNATPMFFSTLFYNNGRHGINVSAGCSIVVNNCDIYNNANTGLIATAGRVDIINTIAYGNATAQFNLGATFVGQAFNIAYGGGGTNLTAAAGSVVNGVTLTADPFVNASAGDFSLNNTSGGGALLRAAGFGAIAPGLTVGQPNIGAWQGGGSLIVVED